MALLPPLQQLGFGTSRWRLQTLHQACAQAEGGMILFLPHERPLLALSEHRADNWKCLLLT